VLRLPAAMRKVSASAFGEFSASRPNVSSWPVRDARRGALNVRSGGILTLEAWTQGSNGVDLSRSRMSRFRQERCQVQPMP